ncbi:hypothetical protein BRD14_06865 [Halobacteriales archaeon SW_5_68_122]|nr:MAG: hypothetical protein BRD14_06865 [Halobacteriales archaeon SW_5_68_122]
MPPRTTSSPTTSPATARDWPTSTSSRPRRSPEGGVRATIVGDDGTIQRVVDAIPDSLTLALEGLGDYHPDSEQLFSVLTERQREILEAAVESGYYEEPRGATHEEIAREVGVSAGTVGEHLRKVEEKVLSSLVR